MSYRAPVSDIAFTLKHMTGVSELLAEGRLGDLSEDLMDAILEEAGKFASEEIAPLNRVGDAEHAHFKDGKVTMPEGWRRVYEAWCAAGWAGLSAPEEFGGQGLPTVMLAATQEMWNAASMAFGVGPTLTVGSIEAFAAHASPEVQERYLKRLVSGEWMATMNLTEPQAGSDLNALRTRAERAGDGSYRLFGQKIFITYGEHDLTDNIVHLVLARLPDAPAGTRGISLFAVPKFLVNEDGSLGPANDLLCANVEEKLGIHGSPTCTMLYGEKDGAVGWLVGEENRGLACMFTMMNNARLIVGLQGVGIAERAFQQALAYAEERRQGRNPDWQGEGMAPIALHPDVRRNLATMKALVHASRAICYACAEAIDRGRIEEGEAGKTWQERANLLTPLAKAFSTDIGFEVASIGVQIHGGMGYVEETGAAQHLRDSRIAMIYEGTNGIQAIDLIMRKLPQSGGEAVRGYLSELREVAERAAASNRVDFGRIGERLNAALDDTEVATEWLLAAVGEGRISEALAGATPYLRLLSLAAGGAGLARGALAAANSADGSGAAAAHIHTARFFAENILTASGGLKETVTGGAASILAADPDLLSA
ncbi:hypothetical protein GGD81_002948 [Rhodobium orientis]|uniref:3-methylmercaptopropionyl-CoA dehydrogenase n=1 Tax=Rhodobium orientis TaxID=34017 RepID=A0A327JKI5_9HYPH|nr:acyl-CoA dehydrogenase [Rhodobium orientis]MBB4303896.1 hypothetical protein [Rhodobium orientis]MBK5951441.1 acyl-CoA dehydrogenase [Rhodobium orientis]RAI26146.1 acyl-CoA dehydrogenase [Rhodobium orientis]